MSLPNNKAIQQADQAGHTKLTAVTIGHGGHKKQFFVMLEHDSKGQAKLPHSVLDKILAQANVRYGETYTVG
jgi:hypothetical protein